MEQETQGLTRRQALGLGAGAVGAWVALKAGAGPALAQPAATVAQPREVTDPTWQAVEAAMGRTSGELLDAGVFRIELPRTDLRPTLFGVVVKPEMGIESEVSFWRTGSTAVMKYELALLEAEVNPVLLSLFSARLSPPAENFTALHNHFLQAVPNVVFLHGFAEGDPVVMASTLYDILATNTRTPFGHGDEPPGNPNLDVRGITGILGGNSDIKNGVLTVSVPRAETPQETGIRLPAAMMFESQASFQSIGGQNAAMTAELVVLPSEADAVARPLHNYGIQITALHNHELQVSPNFYHLHCWGTGPAFRLARGIRAALSVTNSVFR